MPGSNRTQKRFWVAHPRKSHVSRSSPCSHQRYISPRWSTSTSAQQLFAHIQLLFFIKMQFQDSTSTFFPWQQLLSASLSLLPRWYLWQSWSNLRRIPSTHRPETTSVAFSAHNSNPPSCCRFSSGYFSDATWRDPCRQLSLSYSERDGLLRSCVEIFDLFFVFYDSALSLWKSGSCTWENLLINHPVDSTAPAKEGQHSARQQLQQSTTTCNVQCWHAYMITLSSSWSPYSGGKLTAWQARPRSLDRKIDNVRWDNVSTSKPNK